MEQYDLIIDRDDALQLEQALLRFIEDTSVRAVLVMGRDGSLLAQQGQVKGLGVDSLCALAVGAFASSEALARMAGEDSFNSIYHQGVRANVYISLISDTHLLLVLFDYNASPPLVRLQSRVVAEAIAVVLARAYTRTRAQRVTPK